MEETSETDRVVITGKIHGGGGGGRGAEMSAKIKELEGAVHDAGYAVLEARRALANAEIDLEVAERHLWRQRDEEQRDRWPVLSEDLNSIPPGAQDAHDGATGLVGASQLADKAPTIEGTAPEPSTDDVAAPAPPPKLDGFEGADPDSDHPADAAVEEIKALDDEPTGDMTTPPAPNGGMQGWSY